MKKLTLILTIFFTMVSTNNTDAQSNSVITSLAITHIVKYPTSYNTNNVAKRYPLILTLHGHGSNEQDLIGLSEHFQEEILWISGRGPVTLHEGSYDWYQLPPTPEKIATTLNLIKVFIDELCKTYPIDPNKIYLMGFSQGSMMSLSYAMAYPKSVAGVIAQSGAIPSDIGLPIDTVGLNAKPIIITHGIEDHAMPISRGRQTRDLLVKLGADINYSEFHMGHSISKESLLEVKKWLTKKL